MPTDVAKITLDYFRQYDSVVFQQGRVGLEADNNESSRLAQERLRDESADIVGVTGTPDDGYRVSAGAANYDLLVKRGTMYVGGVRVFTAGDITYSSQSDWVDHQGDALWKEPANPGTNELIYLLLQEHEVGAVEDGALKEVALGGPDTCARTKLVQRIVRMGTTKSKCADAMAELKAALATAGLTPDPRSLDANGDWSGGRLVPAGSMQITFQNTGGGGDPCEPQAQGGYTQPDNQMIRVKVTTVAGPNSQLVWAYDDASFVYRAEVQDASTLKLLTTPVDNFHRPRSGQAVEVLRAAARLYTGSSDGTGLLSDSDFVAALDGAVTTLTKDYDPGTQLISLADPLTADYTSSTENPPFAQNKKAMVFVRIWNQKQQFTPGQALTLVSGGVSTGVQVTFPQADPLHVNSYWMVAVRPNTPTKVYPDRYSQDFQPAEGPRTWICPLAVINWVPGGEGPKLNTLEDCRNSFANLVDLSKRCPPPTDAYPKIQNIDWNNDQVISLDRFNQGFGVTFSRAMAPDTIGEQTFRVMLDLIDPFRVYFGGLTSLAGMARILSCIRGVITPSNGNTTFTFVPKPSLTLGELQNFLSLQGYESFVQDPRTPGIPCRILLTGDTILDTNGEPLDGDTFGNVQIGTARNFTRLVMPSPGDGIKGGDFNSWLFIGIPATVQMSPAGTSFATGSGPSQVDLYFSKPMATPSIQAGLTVTSSIAGAQRFKVSFPTDDHAVIQAEDAAGNVLARFPDPPAGQSAVTYTVTLDGQTVVDQDGLQLDGDNSGHAGTTFTGNFKIGLATHVSTMVPTGNVPPNTQVNLITVTFSASIDQNSVKAGSIALVDGNGAPVSGQAQAVNATTAIFTPNPALPIPKAKAAAVTYTATVFGTGPNAIVDANGSPIAGIAGLGPGHDFTGQFTLLPLTGVATVFPKPPSGPKGLPKYPSGAQSQVIITFTGNVTIPAASLQAALTVTSSLGTTPYPGTVSQISPTEVHFDTDPTAGGFVGGTKLDITYTIHLLGHSCIDSSGAAIDGAGTGVSGSDFVSTFVVLPSGFKDPAKDQTPDKSGIRIGFAVKENQPVKLAPEFSASPIASRTRRVTRRAPPAPPAPPIPGGPGPGAALGQPFIRAEERPLVGGPASLADSA